jgi:hypothetical protein
MAANAHLFDPESDPDAQPDLSDSEDDGVPAALRDQMQFGKDIYLLVNKSIPWPTVFCVYMLRLNK